MEHSCHFPLRVGLGQAQPLVRDDLRLKRLNWVLPDRDVRAGSVHLLLTTLYSGAEAQGIFGRSERVITPICQRRRNNVPDGGAKLYQSG
jgi:hypothetical protein